MVLPLPPVPSAATFQLLPFWEKFLVLLHVKFIGCWTLANSSMEQLLSKGVFGWGLCLVDLPVQSLLQMYLAKGCGLGPGQLWTPAGIGLEGLYFGGKKEAVAIVGGRCNCRLNKSHQEGDSPWPTIGIG